MLIQAISHRKCCMAAKSSHVLVHILSLNSFIIRVVPVPDKLPYLSSQPKSLLLNRRVLASPICCRYGRKVVNLMRYGSGHDYND